jgi:hypothetical protein
MLALSLTIQPELMALPLQLGGGAAILYGLWPLIRTNIKFIPIILGTGMFVGGTSLDSTPSTPSPNPPAPAPVNPSGPFASQLVASIKAAGGTKREVGIIAACHRSFSRALRRDGQKSIPVVTDTNKMGAAFAEMQRYYSGSESLFGDKFDAFNKVCRDNALSQGVIGLTNQPLDSNLRNKAVTYYAEIGTILEQYEKTL